MGDKKHVVEHAKQAYHSVAQESTQSHRHRTGNALELRKSPAMAQGHPELPLGTTLRLAALGLEAGLG